MMRKKLSKLLWLSFVFVVTACTTIPDTGMPVETKEHCTFLEKGEASWYGHELAGNKTANGEMFKPDGISAAHKTLPFGSMVKVVLDKSKAEEKSIVVRINDRGPFVHGRIIDLSWGAAKKVGMMDTQPVHIYLCKALP